IWAPNDSPEGVNRVWPNPDESSARRRSKRTPQPKKRSVPYFADLEVELWKQPEVRKQAGVFIKPSSQVPWGLTAGFDRLARFRENLNRSRMRISRRTFGQYVFIRKNSD